MTGNDGNIASEVRTQAFRQAVLEVVRTIPDNEVAELRDKSILITGATGLIGRMLVFTLCTLNRERSLGLRTICVGRSEKRLQEYFGPLQDSGAVLVRADVANSMEGIGGGNPVDFLLHAAADTSSHDMVFQPENIIYRAVRSMRNVLGFARDAKVSKLIFLSSLEVYGPTRKSDGIVTEQCPSRLDLFSPRSSYPEAKRVCEVLASIYGRQSGAAVYNLRLAQTFGAGVSYDDRRVFADFTRHALEDGRIVMKTDGATVRSYLAVNDLVRCLIHLLGGTVASGTYNVCNTEATMSIRDMAGAIAALVPGARVVIDASGVESRGFAPQMYMRMSAERMRSTGWRPLVSAKEMFQQLVDGMREEREESRASRS